MAEWHFRRKLNLIAVAPDDFAEFALLIRVAIVFVENLDLILDADSACLTKALDTICDLAAQAVSHQLFGLHAVKHDRH